VVGRGWHSWALGSIGVGGLLAGLEVACRPKDLALSLCTARVPTHSWPTHNWRTRHNLLAVGLTQHAPRRPAQQHAVMRQAQNLNHAVGRQAIDNDVPRIADPEFGR
jgi:hypothetical protein